jgi:ferric-dicitrate binding protein FerR (iron transport regulator)
MNERGDELQSLCESAIEGRLTPEEAARLDRLVVADREARRYYVEYLHQHACLRWSVAEPAFLASPLLAGAAVAKAPESVRGGWWRPRRRWTLSLAGGMAAAAVLILGVWLGTRSRGGQVPRPVATLSGTVACKWGSGSLPTETGSRLPPGRLRLVEGLARISFADGAEVTLEGPADLELVSPSRCILHAGRLVAKVPDEAIGFTVDTATAVIKDLGTEFGVNAREGLSADVHVFDGLVNVRHRGTGRVEHMQTGESFRFAPEDVSAFDALAEPPAPERPNKWVESGATRLIQISTATGRGRDTYVQPPAPPKDVPKAVLLVKSTTPDVNAYNRKAYIGLDLTPVSGLQIVEAQFSLALAPTGMGFASEVPDATFAVYGLIDESLDEWIDRTILWDNAPANRPGGAALDPAKVVLLGRFEVAQGILSGTREISGPPLVDFLNHDTNGLASLILVRETRGSGREDLVHGFAGKYHPHLLPPTLKLRAVPRRQ